MKLDQLVLRAYRFFLTVYGSIVVLLKVSFKAVNLGGVIAVESTPTTINVRMSRSLGAII